MQYLDALVLRLLDLELVGGHLPAVLQRHDADPSRTHPHCHPGDVERDHGGGLDPVGELLGAGLRLRPARGDLAKGRPGHVEGHVAAADHHDIVAQLHPVAGVRVDQEIHGLQHPVELHARDLQVAASHGADGYEDGREPIVLQGGEREVPAQAPFRAELDTEPEDGADLGLQDLPAQAVRGDPEDHHAARPVRGVQDDRTVAVRGEVVGAGQAGRPGPHDGYPIVPARHHLHRLAPQALAVRALHASPLAGEPLQRTDRDGLVDVAAAAGRLTGGGAHAAADRGEGVRHPGDEVRELVVPGGDGRHVTAGVGEHRAGPGAGNVVVQPLRPNRNGLEPHAATSPPRLGAARTTSS
jgi:hypothetical protein